MPRIKANYRTGICEFKGTASVPRDCVESMKTVCYAAGVDPRKVFPHNLRHLFARIFYSLEKDIVKLADLLGHSNINTTRIYVITTGTEHRRRMENMHLVLSNKSEARRFKLHATT